MLLMYLNIPPHTCIHICVCAQLPIHSLGLWISCLSCNICSHCCLCVFILYLQIMNICIVSSNTLGSIWLSPNSSYCAQGIQYRLAEPWESIRDQLLCPCPSVGWNPEFISRLQKCSQWDLEGCCRTTTRIFSFSSIKYPLPATFGDSSLNLLDLGLTSVGACMLLYGMVFKSVPPCHILYAGISHRVSIVNWGRIYFDSHVHYGFIYIDWTKVGTDILGTDAVRGSGLAAEAYPLMSSTSFSIALWGTKIGKMWR